MAQGSVTETLGELQRGAGPGIKIQVTDNPDWPLRIDGATISIPIGAEGLAIFVEALLDAAQSEGRKVRRFTRRRTGRLNDSTLGHPLKTRVYRTGHSGYPVRVAHRRQSKTWAYRLTASEAVWLAGLIADHFTDEHP